MTEPSRPALRYHGGKWMLAPWIIEHFPPHRVYTEVFGGGASVLLRKPRSYAEVYNDLDAEVVSLFRVLRDETAAAELERRLRLTLFARDEFVGAYVISEDPIETARMTIVRSFMGFGSDGTNIWRKTGFRASSNRSGTTPAHDWANYPDCLAAFTDRLRGVVIENKPAIDVLLQQDARNVLHYIDPPYVTSTRSPGSPRQQHRYTHEMTDEDHVELATVLQRLEGMVVLSGYPSPLYDDLYGDWDRREIASRADGAAPRTEVLWLNAAVRDALAASRMTLFAGGAG